MRKICAKLVTRVLTGEQKGVRKQVCQDHLDEVSENPDFLDNVTTGDETWTFECDTETKSQSATRSNKDDSAISSGKMLDEILRVPVPNKSQKARSNSRFSAEVLDSQDNIEKLHKIRKDKVKTGMQKRRVRRNK